MKNKEPKWKENTNDRITWYDCICDSCGCKHFNLTKVDHCGRCCPKQKNQGKAK